MRAGSSLHCFKLPGAPPPEDTFCWRKWRAHHPRTLLCVLGFGKQDPKRLQDWLFFPPGAAGFLFFCEVSMCMSVTIAVYRYLERLFAQGQMP